MEGKENMTALEKQVKVKEVLSRNCGLYGKCNYCDFFKNEDNTDGIYFCMIRDSENRAPFEDEWDMASAMISD